MELKIGDLVVLRSGGPAMTVSGISKAGVSCLWFEGWELNRGVMPPESLKKNNPGEKS